MSHMVLREKLLILSEVQSCHKHASVLLALSVFPFDYRTPTPYVTNLRLTPFLDISVQKRHCVVNLEEEILKICAFRAKANIMLPCIQIQLGPYTVYLK